MNNDQRTKGLLKGVAVYGIGFFCTKILNFLIVPIYTYYISTSDMGIYDMLISTASLLTPIITLQISDAAYRWLIRNEKVNESIRSTYQVLLFNSILVIIIASIIGAFFEIPYYGLFIAHLLSTRVIQTVQKLLRGLKKQSIYAASSIAYAIINLSLNLIFVCILKKGAESLFVSSIISNLICTALLFIRVKALRVNAIHKPDFSHIKELIKYSAPLVPNQLNWWIMSSSDRYVVNYFIDSSANGVYSIAYKFPSILQLALNIFHTSWQDASIADDKEDSNYYSKLFEKVYVLSFSMLPAITALTQLYITLTMSADYHEAANYVSILFLGTIFQFFSSFYGVGYLKKRKTNKAFSTSIYGAIVNFVINIALIKYIGLYAAAISTLISFVVMWVIREKQNKNTLKIKINYKKFLSLAFLDVVVCVITVKQSPVTDVILLALGIPLFILSNRKIFAKLIYGFKNKMRSIRGEHKKNTKKR